MGKNVKSIEITNPINLVGDVGGKEFILDTNILLNNNTHINLEMQVANEHNWSERSLSYLCRSFDQLYKGQKYEEAVPVIHIGFIDFDLFPEYPEFYTTYMMQNVKNQHLYSSKFKLSVVNLKQIELATEEAERRERTLERDIKLLQQENADLQDKYLDSEEKNNVLENRNIALEDEILFLKQELKKLKTAK